MIKSVAELKMTPKKGCTATHVSGVYHCGFAEGIDVAADYYRGLLEDVINVLDLSNDMVEKHGPLGTDPAEIVQLVLESKDKEIAMLKRGFVAV
jgi:hypothetical protein